mmetsp:Transcript_21234/g.81083  ORF Transcript_21234/g.81083 Transcript_21234/m.81083 type:complete len:222 (+) Transcript_21234:501-1166(+)
MTRRTRKRKWSMQLQLQLTLPGRSGRLLRRLHRRRRSRRRFRGRKRRPRSGQRCCSAISRPSPPRHGPVGRSLKRPFAALQCRSRSRPCASETGLGETPAGRHSPVWRTVSLLGVRPAGSTLPVKPPGSRALPSRPPPARRRRRRRRRRRAGGPLSRQRRAERRLGGCSWTVCNLQWPCCRPVTSAWPPSLLQLMPLQPLLLRLPPRQRRARRLTSLANRK